MLQKSVLLCVTSLSWLRHAKKAFQARRWLFGTWTSVCSVTSLNLWRNYNANSLRRTADIFVARSTGVYYACLLVRRFRQLNSVDRWIDLFCTVFTNTCYFLSSVVYCEYDDIALICHTWFHVGVYKIQGRLLNV